MFKEIQEKYHIRNTTSDLKQEDIKFGKNLPFRPKVVRGEIVISANLLWAFIC